MNRLPNFGTRPRRPVGLEQLNPYLRLERRRPSDDAIERALDNMAARSNR